MASQRGPGPRPDAGQRQGPGLAGLRPPPKRGAAERQASMPALYRLCPLRGPKSKNGQKVVWEWFWALPNNMPKKLSKCAQKVVHKNGPSQLWVQKTAQKIVKKLSKNCQKVVFWKIEVAAFGRAPFWCSIFQKTTFCSFLDNFFTTFWTVF